MAVLEQAVATNMNKGNTLKPCSSVDQNTSSDLTMMEKLRPTMLWYMDWKLWKDSRYDDGGRLMRKRSHPALFGTLRFDIPFKR